MCTFAWFVWKLPKKKQKDMKSRIFGAVRRVFGASALFASVFLTLARSMLKWSKAKAKHKIKIFF